MLDDSGTIVDATLATMFCNGLITMQSMGIGGGFVLNLYRYKDRKAYTLNARERSPSVNRPPPVPSAGHTHTHKHNSLTTIYP